MTEDTKPDFEAIAVKYAGHLRETATDALQEHADACNDPDLEYTGERPDLHDAECEVNAHMLAAVLDDWGVARSERDSLRTRVTELEKDVADAKKEAAFYENLAAPEIGGGARRWYKGEAEALRSLCVEMAGALEDILMHCGIADASPEDKDDIDHCYERAARQALSRARDAGVVG